MRRRLLAISVLLLLTTPVFCAQGVNARVKVQAIYFNGNIETMDQHGSTARAVAINGGVFVGIGSNSDILAQFESDNTVDLKGDTILPGFIDTHSHLQGWGGLGQPSAWLDLSSVNVFEKPPLGDPRCTAHNNDPQYCFIPVQTQDDVIARLKARVQQAKFGEWILATLYEPSRLGHGSSCSGPATNVAFECPNFEDGHAREYLDQVSLLHPIIVGSQSGHIAYANTAMLLILNICGTKYQVNQNCYKPALFPETAVQMANRGQLNEDLNGWALQKAASYLLATQPNFPTLAFNSGLHAYANHGFTFIQEGLTGDVQVLSYWLRSLGTDMPVTAALLYNDGSNSINISNELKKATEWRSFIGSNPKLIFYGIKEFTDGSNQGYTGRLLDAYFNLYFPFTDKDIFPGNVFGDPYLGFLDVDQSTITSRADQVHEAKFAYAIHQNGDGAIASTLAGLEQAKQHPGLRDMMIHFSLASQADLNAAKSMDAGVTFLITNLYYYGLPLCHQVLGPERTVPIYPAGAARDAGLQFSLHADSPVGPPDPLFMIWIAKTRKTQQPSWYPPDANCPVYMEPGTQGISIKQGVKAFTIDAAYVYGLETQRGSIEVGKIGDMVRLSADPLAMENTPDELKNVRVVGTMLRGVYRANSDSGPPVWPE